MEIEKWNQEKLRFEKAEATESDIDDLFYVFEYSNAEASIEETKQTIMENKMEFIAELIEKNKKN